MAAQKNIELCKKLAALAERGVGGEKETAQRKLDQLMKKYNVSTADLTGEELIYHEFKYHGDFEKKLLRQIFYSVNHERSVKVLKEGKGSRSCLFFISTEKEALEARIKYAFYLDLWKEDLDFLFDCFVQKHRIFRSDPNAPVEDCDDKTALRMNFMMAGMSEKNMPPSRPRAIGCSPNKPI